jgi:hypothetical protein
MLSLIGAWSLRRVRTIARGVGNESCGPGENFCNCPSDRKQP